MPGMFCGSPAAMLPSAIDVKKHGAFEALMLRQNASQSRQRLLGAILMVSREEDDVLAFAGPFGAFKDQRRGGREARE
jgi:hypothetical protein